MFRKLFLATDDTDRFTDEHRFNFRKYLCSSVNLSVSSVALLFLSGCNGYSQSKPPTPEGLKLIKARTAFGTIHTKLEAKSQPSPPRAGEVSIWDVKIFDIKDKPTGERQEWKHLLPVPQSENTGNVTDVMMNAWMISRDKTVFLPGKPSYKAYGSFLGDWILPKTGEYAFFAEYKPNGGSARRNLPLEMARWNFDVRESAPKVKSFVARQPSAAREVSVGKFVLTATGERATLRPIELRLEEIRAARQSRFSWSTTSAGARNFDVVALSPDGRTLLHFPSNQITAAFPQSGVWRVWFSFESNGEKFIAPYDLTVAP